MRQHSISLLRLLTGLSIWSATTVVVGVLVLTGQTQAKELTAGEITAGELLAYCKKSEAEGSYCATYIAGFVDGVGRMQADMQAFCLPPIISDAQMGTFRQRFMAGTENGILNTSASTVQIMPASLVLSLELLDMFSCPADSSDHRAEPQHAAVHPYDDCILEHMGTAQNESAAYAIQRACISKASIPITSTFDPAADLDATAWSGEFNIINSLSYGLLVRVKNSTSFNITELVVVVTDRKTNKTNEYVIDSFDKPLSGVRGLI